MGLFLKTNAMLIVREYPKKLPVLYSYTLFTPTFQYFYTDISAISVTFCNSDHRRTTVNLSKEKRGKRETEKKRKGEKEKRRKREKEKKRKRRKREKEKKGKG